MSSSPFRFIRTGFGFFWRMLDTGRRFVLNLLFLLLLILIAIAIFGGGAKKLNDKTALVLDLKGQLLEQRAGNARDLLFDGVAGERQKDTQLRDVLTVLDAAAKDPKIG